MASVNQIPERNLDVGHGAQNSLLAYAHRILTAATPFCSLLPPLAALANVPLSTREPWEAEAPQAVHQVRTVILREDSTKRNQNPSFYTTVPEATGEFFGRLGAGLIGVEDLRGLLRRLGGEAEAGGGEAHSLPVLPVGQPERKAVLQLAAVAPDPQDGEAGPGAVGEDVALPAGGLFGDGGALGIQAAAFPVLHQAVLRDHQRQAAVDDGLRREG